MNVLDFFSLENKVAIVTGGYGYLGKAFVQSLNEAGAKVEIGFSHCFQYLFLPFGYFEHREHQKMLC